MGMERINRLGPNRPRWIRNDRGYKTIGNRFDWLSWLLCLWLTTFKQKYALT